MYDASAEALAEELELSNSPAPGTTLRAVDPTLFAQLYRAHIDDLGQRYAPVLAKAEVDSLVIHSGTPLKRTELDDQYWPLRTTPHFQHWLPLAQPECVLIVTPGKRPRLLWLKSTSFWEKAARPETDHWEASFDIQAIASSDEVKDLLPSGRLAFLGDNRARATAFGIPDDRVNMADVIGPLDRLRAHKTPYEIECLAEANRRAALGHAVARDAFRAGGASELEMHLLFLKATSQDDPDTPYKNIMAVGPHAATLHHVTYDRRASSASPETLLVDAGSTYQGYCSDITRTWVRGSGATASTFVGLVGAVEKMQQRLCAAIKLGEPYEQLHEESHRQVAAILVETGIAKGSPEEVMAAGVTRSFYPHGLGHSLGLQCHDVGCALVKPKQENPYLRNTSTIVAGQAFTVEPGVYFIDGLLEALRASEHSGLVDWPTVDALVPFGGVRIEDDLIVMGGDSVIRNLTREVLPDGGGPIG
jgi:Xaa-Pro dipeptidase